MNTKNRISKNFIIMILVGFYSISSVPVFATENVTINLGNTVLPNETRFHCPDPGIRNPFTGRIIGGHHCRTESRHHNADVMVNITYPSGDTVLRHIRQCATVGAGVAGLASIVASPVAAAPAFEMAFEGCLTDRIGGDMVRRTSFSLDVKHNYSCWSTHC